jgi:hypothetical protein
MGGLVAPPDTLRRDSNERATERFAALREVGFQFYCMPNGDNYGGFVA